MRVHSLVRFVLVLGLLAGSLNAPAHASGAALAQNGPAAAAAICLELLPSSSVEVDQEILMYADQCSPLTDPLHAKYEWDFGDNTTLPAEGRGVTHFYARPGTFTVHLRVTEGVLVDAGDPTTDQDDLWSWPGPPTEYTATVTVSGAAVPQPPLVAETPILELKFEDSIADTSGHDVAVGWAAGMGSFTDGIQGRALDLSGGKYLTIANGGALMGRLPEFTVSFWFKKNSTASFGHILDQWDAQAQSQFGTGIRLRFGVDVGTGTTQSPFYGMYLRTTSGLLTAAQFSNVGQNNTRWHHAAITYSSAAGRAHLYLDGVEINNSPYTYSGVLATSPAALTIGGDWNGNNIFNGSLDELKIYAKALTREQLYDGVVVRHADFQGRVAQYVTVQIPDLFRTDPLARMKVFVSGGALGSGEDVVLADKDHLAQVEKVLLRNATLAGSTTPYNFTAQLRDAGGSIVYEKVEHFSKSYDGAPQVGLDENNATVVDGELIYPFGPFGLDNNLVADWASHGYQNVLIGQGFWPPAASVAGFDTYLDLGLANGLQTIGPLTQWDGQADHNAQNSSGGIVIGMSGRSDLHKIGAYVTALKDHPGLFAWDWFDEPNVWIVGAPTVRSWTYQSHLNDDRHLVMTNFMGYPYSDCASNYWKNERKIYTYEYNANYFGRRTPVVDIYKFDIYPIDAAQNPTAPDGSLNCYISALENFRTENGDFVPTWSSIETADATGSSGGSLWKPTPAQVRMLVWINIIHEVKGFLWFQYFRGTPLENLTEMARLVVDVNRLAPAALGPRLDRTVNVAYDQTARVDTMLREYNGELYLFAVRVSESESSDAGRGYLNPIQAYPVKATFTLSGVETAMAAVHGEGRSLLVTDGTFSDTFAPYAVHIYKLSFPALELEGRASDRMIDLDWQVNGTLPVTATWQIAYTGGPQGIPASPITGIPNAARSYTLTQLTNYATYTITLQAMVADTAIMTDTVTLMPTDKLLYLPVVAR